MNIILLDDGTCIVTAEDPDDIADDNPGWADLPVTAARCLGFKNDPAWGITDAPCIEIQTTILPSATTPNEDQGIEDEINSAIGERTMLRIYTPVEKAAE